MKNTLYLLGAAILSLILFYLGDHAISNYQSFTLLIGALFVLAVMFYQYTYSKKHMLIQTVILIAYFTCILIMFKS